MKSCWIKTERGRGAHEQRPVPKPHPKQGDNGV
jgi:hypothetical protein